MFKMEKCSVIDKNDVSLAFIVLFPSSWKNRWGKSWKKMLEEENLLCLKASIFTAPPLGAITSRQRFSCSLINTP